MKPQPVQPRPADRLEHLADQIIALAQQVRDSVAVIRAEQDRRHDEQPE